LENPGFSDGSRGRESPAISPTGEAGGNRRQIVRRPNDPNDEVNAIRERDIICSSIRSQKRMRFPNREIVVSTDCSRPSQN
jgi:hypothetical protein